jgi:DNA-binding helix-hairpin-helix protein with protein kinase domain
VGTPHFTPPELQNKKLRDVLRDPNNDRFGLAVLIFHLLFVGRHPFAGRFFGRGEMTIERAIAERRFAFSRDKNATLMEPPPASLVLDDLPPGIGEFFERAFRHDGGEEGRPTAHEWAVRLDELIRQRAVCSFDPTHIYYSRLRQCPWCRIEDEGGPAFFVADASASMVSTQRMDHLDAKIKRLVIPAFPELEQNDLKIPQAMRPKRWQKRPAPAKPDVGVGLLVLSAACCLASAYSGWALIAGAVLAVAGGGLLYFSTEGKKRRKEADVIAKRLADLQKQLFRRAHAITTAHQARLKNFEKSVDELRAEQKNYRDADKNLKDVLAIYRVTQKNRWLAQHMLQDHAPRIRGLGASMASMLQSYGIESAADIDSMKLLGVPMLSPELTLELMNWRQRIEQDFVFKPEHGVGPKDAGGKAAVARFKAAQSRRILIASRQLESVAHAAHDELRRELRDFDKVAQMTQEAVKELRQLQSGRREWERELNRSPLTIAAATVAPPVVGWIIRWLFG